MQKNKKENVIGKRKTGTIKRALFVFLIVFSILFLLLFVSNSFVKNVSVFSDFFEGIRESFSSQQEGQLGISYSPPTMDTFPEDYREYVYETSSGNNLLRVFAGIETAGIHISRTTINSSISYMRLFYKPSGSSQWIRGHDFTDQITKTIPTPPTFTHVPMELYISSLFNLQSNTNYDLRVDFFSSEGSMIGSISLSFVTQPDVFSFTPLRTIIVNPGESIQAAIDGATPGTRILVNPGIYREALSFNSKSGTPGNWIQVIASGAGVVLDGSNPDPQSQIFGTWSRYLNSAAVSGSNMWTTTVPGPYWAIWTRSADGDYNYLFRHVSVGSISTKANFLDASSGHNSDGCDNVTSPLNAKNYVSEGQYVDGDNNLFIRLEPGKDPNTLDFKVSEHSVGININNSDWIWIEGFNIQYFGSKSTPGSIEIANTTGSIYINNGNHNIIRKNSLVPNINGVMLTWADENSNGLVDDGAAYNRIEGNKISTKIRPDLTTYCKTKKGGGFWGVSMGGSIGNILRGNEVYNIGENSLQLQMRSDSQEALGCIDLNDNIFGFHCPDFNYFLGFENDFYDNYIHDNVEGLEMDGPHSVNTRLFRNKLKNIEMNFISMQSGQFGPTWIVKNLWVRNSSSIYSGGEILKIRYPAIHRYIYMYHNTFFHQYGQIYSRRDDNLYVKLKIYNNLFHVVSGTVARFYDATLTYLPYKKSPDMDYNSYSSGTKPIVVYDNSYNRVQISQICSIYGIDCHGIMVDALFSDAIHGNFALSSTSSNIDAAASIFGINNIYNGIAPDIGAYEYGTGIYCDNDWICEAGETIANCAIDCSVLELNEIIVDNSDSQFSYVGSCSTSGSSGYFGSNSIYSQTVGGQATWEFNWLTAGEYDVYAWWTYASGRAINAPYSIYNGESLLAIERVNQRDSALAGKWVLLGRYNLGTSAKVVLNVESTESHNADAVKIVYVGVGQPGSCIDSDGDGYNLTAGVECGAVVDCNDNNASIHSLISCNYNGDSCGNFEMCLGSCLNVPVENCTDSIDNDCDDVVNEGCSFQTVVDDLDSGFLAVGTWTNSGGANPYNGSSIYSKTLGDNASWSVANLPRGKYQINAWWTYFNTRPQNATYKIYNNYEKIGEQTVNQRDLNLGGKWNTLGEYLLEGNASVVLEVTTGDSYSADAIQFLKTGEFFSNCTPTIEICDGIDNDCDNEIDENNGDCSGATPYCSMGKCIICLTSDNCNDGNQCTDDICIGDSCQNSNSLSGVVCNDGFSCTEGDICTLGNCIGTVINVDDGISCTVDSCDEFDGIKNIPYNNLCIDEFFCNGVEYCDASLGCWSGVNQCTGVGQSCNESGDRCENCAFTNAFWNTANVVAGQNVTLTLQGSNCNGMSANFSVWEDDTLSGDDASIVKPTNAVFNDNTASTTWNAEWQCDGNVLGVCTEGLPEYYFVATLGINMSVSRQSNLPMLIVNELSPTCRNGIIQGSEQCDDGNSFNNDSCTNSCLNAICGDTYIRTGLEICDGNTLACMAGGYTGNRNCNFSCSGWVGCIANQSCGDGIVQVGAGEQCDDHNLINGDGCNSTCKIEQCTDDANCTDWLYCNGIERCSVGVCVVGIAPTLSDGISCTVDSCDEVNDRVLHGLDNSVCQNGAWCDGVETCTSTGCVVGTAQSCNDGISCTADSCNEGVNMGDNLGSCIFNTSACSCTTNAQCDDGNPCTDDICTASLTCQNTIDNTNSCNDGAFCTVSDRCSAGSFIGDARVVNDGVGCTMDSCDEINNVIVHGLNNSVCDDGVYCNGTEVCTLSGCSKGTAPTCNDGQSCTIDSCNEISRGCNYFGIDSDSDGFSICAGAFADCNDTNLLINPGRTEICNGRDDNCVNGIDENNGNCVGGIPYCVAWSCAACRNNADCDNWIWCDGTETCNAGVCVDGADIICTDSVGCTVDSCNEINNKCDNVVNNSYCNDGNPCN